MTKMPNSPFIILNIINKVVISVRLKKNTNWVIIYKLMWVFVFSEKKVRSTEFELMAE